MNRIEPAGKKIYVAGHRGLVGSAIVGALRARGCTNIVTRTHAELDLLRQADVEEFFSRERPEVVFLAAARVGGISANNRFRADFLYENLEIQTNVIRCAAAADVEKLIFLGSTCIYPRMAPQPITEESLLTGELEYTNEPYAVAKIAGMKLCESYNLQYGTNFVSVMPTNLYGPGDNFDLEDSHVLPAMLRKIHLANLLRRGRTGEAARDLGCGSEEEAGAILARHAISADAVTLWGSGKPRREFLWSEDMADACVFIAETVDFPDLASGMTEPRNTHINIGTGEDIPIAELASLIAEIVDYTGRLIFDTSKPDGTPRKLTDVSRLHALGWKHRVDLPTGIRRLYEWYLQKTNERKEGIE